jgi:hypothetical protein
LYPRLVSETEVVNVLYVFSVFTLLDIESRPAKRATDRRMRVVANIRALSLVIEIMERLLPIYD